MNEQLVTPSTPETAAPRTGLPRVVQILLKIVLGLLALILVVFAIGSVMPPNHEVGSTIVLHQPVASVYHTIVDWEQYPSWRTELDGVSAVADPNGHPRWLEDWKGDQDIELQLTAMEPEQRVEIAIHDPSKMFSGTWEFLFAPEGDDTQVTLTERGTIPNPAVRAMMAMIPGAKGYCLNLYLQGLKAKYGEGPVPTPMGQHPKNES